MIVNKLIIFHLMKTKTYPSQTEQKFYRKAILK